MLWVVHYEENEPHSRYCDEGKHHEMVSPLITVAVEEIIAVTDPVLHNIKQLVIYYTAHSTLLTLNILIKQFTNSDR